MPLALNEANRWYLDFVEPQDYPRASFNSGLQQRMSWTEFDKSRLPLTTADMYGALLSYLAINTWVVYQQRVAESSEIRRSATVHSRLIFHLNSSKLIRHWWNRAKVNYVPSNTLAASNNIIRTLLEWVFYVWITIKAGLRSKTPLLLHDM